MRQQFTALGLSAIVLTLAACAPGAMPITDADRAAIGELRETFRQAVLANDGAAIAAVYTADGVEMPPNMPLNQGRSAIEQAAMPFAVDEFLIRPAATEGIGDLAYEHGTFTFTGTPEGMPMAMADTGKYTVTLRRQADGSWKFGSAIWNTDLPLPMPPEMY